MVPVRLPIRSGSDLTGFDCLWLIAYKNPCHPSLFGLFSSSLSRAVVASSDSRPEMSTEATIRSSVSEEAVLELLLGAGLDRAEAINLLDSQPEQSSTMLVPEGQRPTSEDAIAESQSAQPSSVFERSIVATLERMSQRLDDLSARVGESSRVSPSPSPTTLTPPTQTPLPGVSRNWADIPVDEVHDYSAPLVWEDDAEETVRPLLQVTENTAKALKVAFGRPLPNQARLQARKPYPFPDVEVTRCPKLDPVAKQLLQREQKQADASLARLQTLVLDAVAPLTYIVEGSLTGEQAAEAAKAALSLLGNATAQISRERRKKVILSLNKKVHPLAEDEDTFAEAAPLLLGKVFEAKMKTHLESLKCLSAAREREPQAQYFRQSRSHRPPRGGGAYRGRGGGNQQRRFQPYTGQRGKENMKQSFQRQNKN